MNNKTGDKIRHSGDGDSYLIKGNIYTVKGSSDHASKFIYPSEIEDYVGYGYRARDFELVTEERTSKFKAGDRVICKKPLSSFGRDVGRAEVGKTYTVRAIHKLQTMFYVEGIQGYLDEDDFELAECLWKQEENQLYRNLWHTGCGKTVQYAREFPSENRYVFCPYCGIPIKPEETEVKPGAGTKVKCVKEDEIFDLCAKIGDILTVKRFNSIDNSFEAEENEGIWLLSRFELMKENEK